VRISFAMAQDKEMPSVMGALHGKHATPHKGVWILVAVSAVLGAIGVYNVTALTGITLASNIGTFILYGLICALTFVAFAGREEFHGAKHLVIPLLGLLGNAALLVGIVVIGLKTPGVSANATKFALWMTLGWGLVSGIYLVLNSKAQKRSVLSSVVPDPS
jgi:amino acid transporter